MKVATFRGAEVNVVDVIGSYFFRFVSDRISLESVWAYLVSTEVRRSGWASKINIKGGINISLEKATSYERIISSLPGTSLYEMIFYHPAIAKGWPGQIIVLVSESEDEIPPAFLPRLQKIATVPLLPEWEQDLWDLAQSEDFKADPVKSWRSPESLIKKYRGSVGDLIVWTINVTDRAENAWGEIVKTIIEKERING